MARKDNGGDETTPVLQRYDVYGMLGKFRTGDTVTTADLFPGVDDQAELDRLTLRLVGLNAIAPAVEYATNPVAIESAPIPAVDISHDDNRTIAGDPPAPITIKAPAFKPVAPAAKPSEAIQK